VSCYGIYYYYMGFNELKYLNSVLFCYVKCFVSSNIFNEIIF
jgi:hypothetical protein